MKIKNAVMENGKTIFGVVAGLAIAGASLFAARKGGEPADDYDEDVEVEEESEESSDGPAEEESSEE